jgi:hypothetical protein
MYDVFDMIYNHIYIAPTAYPGNWVDHLWWGQSDILDGHEATESDTGHRERVQQADHATISNRQLLGVENIT